MARTPKPKAETKSKKTPVTVDSITHAGDARTNIPTRETASFATESAEQQKKVLYPRDPSLDPQLVWRGKDEQDAGPLSVPAVPIYVQEKIHPRAIIEDLKARSSSGKPQQLDFFSDFNGLDDFSKKLDFYQHDQHWTNRLILGDSLLVMTSLAEKERLRGQVQSIYFDPPYGIKFGSNWQVSTRKRDVKDAKAEDLTRQPEQIKAFRDTWELGIHSYLTYLRDRLAVARDLLTESGSIFVQIGDENVHLVRCLMDEVFGANNFVSQVAYTKTTGATVVMLSGTTDYILWFAKSIEHAKYRRVFSSKVAGGDGAAKYDQVEVANERRSQTSEERRNPECLPTGARPYRFDNLMSQSMGREKGEGAACWFPIKIKGREFRPTIQSRWKTNEEGIARLLVAKRIEVTGNSVAYVRYLDDFPAFPITNSWTDIGGIQSRADPKIYVVQTATTAVERCLLMTTDPGDLVLDPTCGSGTTAYVAEQWGRRWITTDTSRVALALARTRIMSAKYPYYLLADTPVGRKKQRELNANEGPPLTLNPSPPRGEGDKTGLSSEGSQPDIHQGFVYKTVPHVTLKSIANNPDIKEGMTRAQIDAAIAKHAETETLYDQPYEDKGIVRVAGPFTVESLSPHKALSLPPDEQPAIPKPVSTGNYVQTVLDNLRKAGVRGMDKRERIQFTRLDSYPGTLIQAEGTTDAGMGVRVSIGPELGTVGDQWIKDAAMEAIRGSKPDVLLVCAFAFEASVHEQTAALTKEMQFGKLRILPVRMNPDLAMFGDETGKELLKKTGTANLFTVFGEPDLKVETNDGKVTVAIKGLDVFDPTTGEVRTGGTDDIACWFIDTDYDGASFFVRHAYFCGADEPYERLKKALRAEIDEAEWAKIYSTTSVPFDPPTRGKIAVKVINHFGDEIMKVVNVAKKVK